MFLKIQFQKLNFTEKMKKTKTAEDLQEKLDKKDEQMYILKLFITGLTLKSTKAVNNAKKICEGNLKGRYQLDVIDVYQQPEIAKTEQIIAAPTLVKKLPPPIRKIVGDLSDTEKVMIGLNIEKD